MANKSVAMVRGACAQPRKHQGSHAARGFEDPQPRGREAAARGEGLRRAGRRHRPLPLRGV